MTSQNAMAILQKRYLQRDAKGEIIETKEEMFRRVAHHVALPTPENEQEFYNIMANLQFLPNSPTLFNAGTDQGNLSACFVLNPDDTMKSIMQVATDLAMIQKWGGGTGFGFSKLRPKGSHISTTHGKACGPVAVLKMYSEVSQMITQGGKRNGANMGMLKIDHPDIREFIHLKDDGRTAQNFNISVQVTNEFMEGAVGNPLWEEIVDSAWRTGDPGLSFIDTVNQTKYRTEELLEASNPCGEEYLENYGSCNLGSINLSKFVLGSGGIDWVGIEETVRIAVRFLNNVILTNKFPVAKLKEVNLRTKRIGLGIMGWHDMLLLLRIPYDSGQAVLLGEQIMEEITRIALSESNGRNLSVTTIAPTGSIASIAECSFGIEPVFAWEQEKHVLEGQVLTDIHPLYKQAKEEGWYTPELFKTAQEIPWIRHIEMQMAFQKHTTNSVSKTINMPESATREDISAAYLHAWKLGCKGITVYRDKSKPNQVLYDAAKLSKTKEKPRVRPRLVKGFTEQVPTGDGNIYVTYNQPLELFATRGKGGSCDSANIEGLTRIISLALRWGINVKEIAGQLAGIACHPIPGGAMSVPDAIAKVLMEEEGIKLPIKRNGNVCPDCQEPLVHQENCETCLYCGFSRC